MPDPCVVDSSCVNLTVDGDGALLANLILDPSTCNGLVCGAAGLFAQKNETSVDNYKNSSDETYDGATKSFVGGSDPSKGADVSVVWSNPSACSQATALCFALPGNDRVTYTSGTRESMDYVFTLLANAVAQDVTQSRLDNGSLANGIIQPAAVPVLAASAVVPASGAVTFRAYKESGDVNNPATSSPYPHPDLILGRTRLWVIGFVQS